MDAIDDFTPPKALGAGVVLSALNPKNLILTIAGMAAIVSAGIPADEEAVALVVFTVIGSLGVAIPVVMYFALGDRSGPLLERLKDWMAQNNAVIMAVILLLIGVKLIGDAISGLLELGVSPRRGAVGNEPSEKRRGSAASDAVEGVGEPAPDAAVADERIRRGERGASCRSARLPGDPRAVGPAAASSSGRIASRSRTSSRATQRAAKRQKRQPAS